MKDDHQPACGAPMLCLCDEGLALAYRETVSTVPVTMIVEAICSMGYKVQEHHVNSRKEKS